MLRDGQRLHPALRQREGLAKRPVDRAKLSYRVACLLVGLVIAAAVIAETSTNPATTFAVLSLPTAAACLLWNRPAAARRANRIRADRRPLLLRPVVHLAQSRPVRIVNKGNSGAAMAQGRKRRHEPLAAARACSGYIQRRKSHARVTAHLPRSP
jgi:hypothetical protein